MTPNPTNNHLIIFAYFTRRKRQWLSDALYVVSTNLKEQFFGITFCNIFTLLYKSGKGENDVLNTVNRFNPGGLALTTMAVDYAPNGYWSAYQDSQPVALKMSLNFAELRPIYKSDHERLPEDSVGY